MSGVRLEEKVESVLDGIFISADNFLGDPGPLFAVFQKITNQRIILLWTPISSIVNGLLTFLNLVSGNIHSAIYTVYWFCRHGWDFLGGGPMKFSSN